MQINVPLNIDPRRVSEIIEIVIGDDEYFVNDDHSTHAAEAVVGLIIAEWAQTTIDCDLHRSAIFEDMPETREKLLEAGLIKPTRN